MTAWVRLASNAEDFRSAAEQLLRLSGERTAPNLAFPAPIVVLTGYAWELFLKAFLAKAGASDQRIQGFKHDLPRLRLAAENNGWSFTSMVRAARDAKTPIVPQPDRDALFDSASDHFHEIWQLTDFPSDHAARYPGTKQEVPWPEAQLEIIAVSLEELRL